MSEDSRPDLATVLNRPASERLREYKYRFAQSTVFGLPVIALHYVGPLLGGPEAGRWVGLLQLLMGGWVIYVGAMGMLVEGLMLKKLTMDAAVGGAAVIMYLLGAGALAYFFITARATSLQGIFHWPVLLIIGWTALQWFRFAER